MLTCDLTFRSKDIAHLFEDLLRGKVSPPNERNPGISVGLNTLVQQLLNKNPESRPESARAVEATLAILQSERPFLQPSLLNLANAPLRELADSLAQACKDWAAITGCFYAKNAGELMLISVFCIIRRSYLGRP